MRDSPLCATSLLRKRRATTGQTKQRDDISSLSKLYDAHVYNLFNKRVHYDNYIRFDVTLVSALP